MKSHSCNLDRDDNVGLTRKSYDMVAEKGVTWNPLCLQEHLSRHPLPQPVVIPQLVWPLISSENESQRSLFHGWYLILKTET